MLNLGHSPLYRHFCKCLYIEMLKINLFIKYYILFFAMAKFKQACFAHDLSKKLHTFFRHGKVQASLTLLMTYRKSFIHFTHMWFSAALDIAQTSLALHSLARKFFARQCQLGILSFECCNRLCRLPEQELRVIRCYACDWELFNCELKPTAMLSG